MSEIPRGIQSQLTGLAGGLNGWRLARWAALLPRIAALEPELQALGDEQLRKRSLSLRYRAKSGEPLARLLVEGYALVREAARRTLNMRHFDVQLLGGIAMFHRSIVEMQTGEGKTLTATLPLYLRGLLGKGCHLATVNDYLARRDAEWMRPIYEALGHDRRRDRDARCPSPNAANSTPATLSTARRRSLDSTSCEIGCSYAASAKGQNRHFGRNVGPDEPWRPADEKPVQREGRLRVWSTRPTAFLIDEARTPLIISALPTEEEKPGGRVLQAWSSKVVIK